jgi:sec-independent protein translocase protein TatB
MEILGIGPGEFFFILIILLVVVGPERLPDLARRAGQLLVRGRNWLQSSPDAAMVLRARQEIEQELANIRSSLMEVQSVRDEVLGAAKQIGAEVNSLTSITKTELDSIGSLVPPKPTNPLAEMEAAIGVPQEPIANAETPPVAEQNGITAEPVPETEPAAAEAAQLEGTVPQLRQPRQPLPQAPEPSAYRTWEAQTALESIDVRLQAIMADLFAMQEQLKQRGALAEDWQPPSWNIQLPATAPAGHAAPSEPVAPGEPAETEEAPNV